MNLNQEAIAQEAARLAGILAQSPDTDPSELLTIDQWKWYRDHLLQAWNDSKVRLDVAKVEEMEARKKAVDFAFDPTKHKGTERIDLGNGWQAKAVKKINYGWIKTADDKVDNDKIETALEKIESTGAAGELIAARLVKWTPDLSLTEYNQLPEDFKKIIDEVIVTSDGTPTLEIIPPKK